MIGAGAVASSAGSAVASATTSVISGVLFGSFNPNYNKEDRRRMRYIQLKYAQAYDEGASGDPNTVISNIDANSKLKMSPDGIKPANPFPDERSFEEALVMNFHPTPGHQGKFCASHALSSIGTIIQFQILRRKRFYLPGLLSAGKPNDYINMFLEEMKSWLRTQLTLDVVNLEELRKRSTFIKKLKHDKYYWCFPPESISEINIHNVIDFIQEKVENALDMVERENKNKSLQQMFMEMNDHTVNSIEFGKNFLAYLLCISKVAGADLVTSKDFNGKNMEMGKLHRILLKATDTVMSLYAVDLKRTEQRLGVGSTNEERKAIEEEDVPPYALVDEVTCDVSLTSGASYNFNLIDRQGAKWVVTHKFNDYENLYNSVMEDFDNNNLTLDLSVKKGMFMSKEDHNSRCPQLKRFVENLLIGIPDISESSRKLISDFLIIRTLVISNKTRIIPVEKIPNNFITLKSFFQEILVDSTIKEEFSRTNNMCNEKMKLQLLDLRLNWGHDVVVKILDCYSILQQLSVILSWTLEINHFFISMFGNTLVFTKLPLREIVVTLKGALVLLSNHFSDLNESMCGINAKNDYKWHKNIETAESELKRCKYHISKTIETITRIELEHLDKDVQMKRLQDVAARFGPLLQRVGNTLPAIQQECRLPISTASYEIGMDVPSNGMIMNQSDNGSQLMIDDRVAPPKETNRIEYLDDVKYDAKTPSDSKGISGGDVILMANARETSAPLQHRSNHESNSTSQNNASNQSAVCIVS